MPNAKFEVDTQKGRIVFGRLLEAFRKGDYPFHNYVLPQDLIPTEVRENAIVCSCILFYSCHYMRGTIKSDHAMKRMVALYRQRPDFFDPSKAAQLAQEEVHRVLRSILPYKAEEISRFWIENSRRLVTHWDANPINIFKEVHGPADLYRFIANKDTTRDVVAATSDRENGFLGFQKKMASMVAYFFIALKLIDAKEIIPPVDFHHVRVQISSGIIKVPTDLPQARYEQLQPFAMKALESFMTETGAAMLEIGDAIWLLSLLLCSRAPSNQTSEGELVRVEWGNESSLRHYKAACGACPISQYCDFAVQANSYYQKGYFELNRPRQKPGLTEQLPFTELAHYAPKRRQGIDGGTKKTERGSTPLLFSNLPLATKPT